MKLFALVSLTMAQTDPELWLFKTRQLNQRQLRDFGGYGKGHTHNDPTYYKRGQTHPFNQNSRLWHPMAGDIRPWRNWLLRCIRPWKNTRNWLFGPTNNSLWIWQDDTFHILCTNLDRTVQTIWGMCKIIPISELKKSKHGHGDD